MQRIQNCVFFRANYFGKSIRSREDLTGFLKSFVLKVNFGCAIPICELLLGSDYSREFTVVAFQAAKSSACIDSALKLDNDGLILEVLL